MAMSWSYSSQSRTDKYEREGCEGHKIQWIEATQDRLLQHNHGEWTFPIDDEPFERGWSSLGGFGLVSDVLMNPK